MNHSRGAYTVNQEAVKVEEKRTDIRLTSSHVDIEAAIELKLDDKEYRWTGLGVGKSLKVPIGGTVSEPRTVSFRLPTDLHAENVAIGKIPIAVKE